MGEHFKTNAAILENRDIPILAFTRVSNSDYFTFQGVFSYANHNAENDGARWFELVLRNSQPADIVTNAVYLEDDFVTREIDWVKVNKHMQPHLVMNMKFMVNP